MNSEKCLAKYGYPDVHMERKHMELWDLPDGVNRAIPTLPNRVYCNKDMVQPLWQALQNVIKRDLACHIFTWDGCFNIRKVRGGSSWSLHSWGIAVDINAAWNRLGQEPQMPPELVKCFTDAGFEWGGTWTRKDGMHFQLKTI